MKLDKQLMMYKNGMRVRPQEGKVQETIQKSKEAFWASEQEKMLSYHEFLWAQFRLVRKRWWGLQVFLLFLSGAALSSVYTDSYMQRGMGVMASIFVILIIPELWKNRSYYCLEIEESSYYSLRQIYAARMVLFGIVDTLLLTVFCGTMAVGLHMEFERLLIQFLLPMLVTACICFGTLCSKYVVNETAAVFLCLLWCAVWFAVTLNEKIYTMVTMPVWLACIGLSLIFLCVAVCRTLNTCGDYWEVGFDGIRAE